MGLKEVAARWKKRWQALSPQKKILIPLIVLSVLVSLLFLLRWAGKTEMAPLFTDLDPKDAAAVVEELKKAKVEYELADQGATILVPQKNLYDLRLQIAGNGVISSGGVGFELFDQNKLGVTDFDRRLNYQRALQEELRRTIVQLDEVEQARVHLVLPEKSVFVETETPSSASVALKFKPGQKLDAEQVRGIILLIADSVEGLKPENVAVIDTEGNILSEELDEENAGNLSGTALKHHQMKEAFEHQVENQVEMMLDKIFGPGKAVAMINADLDFDQREKHSVTYGNQVIKSESGVKEGENGTGPEGGGVAGVEGNIPEYNAIDSTAGDQAIAESSNSEEFSRNYEVDTTEEKTVSAPGDVKKLSVAVVVDGSLSAEKINQVQNLVIAAVGLQPDRGDQITVSGMPFDTSFQSQMEKGFTEEAEQAKKTQEMVRILIGAVLAGLLLLISAGVVYRLIKKRKQTPLLDVVVEEPVPLRKIEEEAGRDDEIAERKVQQEKARRYLEDQPEQAANILKTWLSYEE